MEWKVITDRVYTSMPYRIEKVRHKFYLYKNLKIENRWSMKLIGKWDDLADAQMAAEEDSRQKTLWEN